MEGRFNGGFFAFTRLGAYIWRGLFSEFYGSLKDQKCTIIFGIQLMRELVLTI